MSRKILLPVLFSVLFPLTCFAINDEVEDFVKDKVDVVLEILKDPVNRINTNYWGKYYLVEEKKDFERGLARLREAVEDLKRAMKSNGMQFLDHILLAHLNMAFAYKVINDYSGRDLITFRNAMSKDPKEEFYDDFEKINFAREILIEIFRFVYPEGYEGLT